MTRKLPGAPAAAALLSRAGEMAARLKEEGICPKLAVVRVGERADDLAYERGIEKRMTQCGAVLEKYVFPDDVTDAQLADCLDSLSAEPSVHGILLFRPLPKGLNEAELIGHIAPQKDIDGACAGSLAGVFTGSGTGFAPSTARAVIELLKYYEIPLSGTDTVVLGRSLVVGRPLAMLLLRENATVTVCHTRTVHPEEIARKAALLVCATGQMESVGSAYFAPGQTVIDVGIAWNEKKNKLCGDVLAEEAEGVADALTPVPGGVGAVTSAVLALQLMEAAERQRRGTK